MEHPALPSGLCFGLELGQLRGCHALAAKHPNCISSRELVSPYALKERLDGEVVFGRDDEMVALLGRHLKQRGPLPVRKFQISRADSRRVANERTRRLKQQRAIALLGGL